MLTYGDGVADVNIEELVKFHRSHGKTVTMTAVNVGQQFGVLEIDQNGRIRPSTMHFRKLSSLPTAACPSACPYISRNPDACMPSAARSPSYVGSETFMLTYGDGVADVNIEELVKFHRSHGKIVTMTAVKSPAAYIRSR